MRQILSVLLFVVTIFCNAKQKSVVWEKPFSASIYPLVVTRVEMNQDETVVSVKYNSDGKITFVKETYLLANGKRYPLTNAEGITLDEWLDVPSGSNPELTFHFSPLPLDTKDFELHEGDGDRAFVIGNIGERKWIEKKLNTQIFPTAWRNTSTGDFELAMLDDIVLYDGQFWKYKSKDAAKCHFVVTNGKEDMTIDMGKAKAGERMISFNGGKGNKYNAITSSDYPDYPIKSTTHHFRNNCFREDSVTIKGYIYGIKGFANIDVVYNGDIFESLMAHTFHVDSTGCFKFTIPWREGVKELYAFGKMFPIEPGETYFYYENRMLNQKFFMGKNGRLQNEWLSMYGVAEQVLDRPAIDSINNRVNTIEEVVKRKEDVSLYLNKANQRLDSVFRMHPNMSARCEDYLKATVTYIYGKRLLSSLELKVDYPEHVMNFIRDEVWGKRNMEFPFAADQFLNNRRYLNFEFWKRMPNTIDICAESEDDSVQQWMMIHINGMKEVVDSLCTDSMSKSLFLADRIIDVIKDNAHSLPEAGRKIVDEDITVPGIKEHVLKTSARYENIGRKELNCIEGYVDAKSLEDITDGETLLAKIIEPYKGRIVYLDVWGTWCTPCKNALSKSAELKEALKEFDIVYLYLANNSPEETWEKIINTYGLTDENCVHYNLPKNQQNAIERFLDVHAFPTYKLFDKAGKMIDGEHEPYNLDALKRVLREISK